HSPVSSIQRADETLARAPIQPSDAVLRDGILWPVFRAAHYNGVVALGVNRNLHVCETVSDLSGGWGFATHNGKVLSWRLRQDGEAFVPRSGVRVREGWHLGTHHIHRSKFARQIDEQVLGGRISASLHGALVWYLGLFLRCLERTDDAVLESPKLHP